MGNASQENQDNDDAKRSEREEKGSMLLKRICPYIRFGRMNPKYFVKNVKPMKCLNAQQIADIVTYFICPEDEKCGDFNFNPRSIVHRSRSKARSNPIKIRNRISLDPFEASPSNDFVDDFYLSAI